MAEASPLAFRVPEAARRIGVSRSTLYQLIDSGELESIRLPGSRVRLVTDEALRKLLERGRQGGEEVAR